MKTKLFITTIIAMIISVTSLIGQERTDYQEVGIAGYPSGTEGYTTSMSASYYFGQSWFFEWIRDMSIFDQGWKLNYSALTANSDGTFEEQMLGNLESVGLQFLNNPQLNSCVFHNTLFVFYSYEDYEEEDYKIAFWTKTPYTEIYETMNEISINEEITRQMAAVGVNDTLYLFFVDHADGKVKYYRAKYKPAANGYPIGLEWISSTPIIISNTLKPHGNVSACSYTDENNHEKIMLVYASNSSSRNSNEVIMFSGTHNNFELFKQFETHADYPAENIYIAQGSVKGGEKNAYMFQLGYCNPDAEETQGPIRCEIRYDNQTVSDWEITTVNSYDSPGNKLSGFMAYYTKHSTKREKHLYQMFIDKYTPLSVRGLHWYSDKLEYVKTRSEIAPFNYGGSFFDLTLVAEGPPPYALNGYELDDPEFDGNPPTVFDYVVTNGEAVSTKSTYSLGVETNMGYGPVTAGFKASFQESSGTTVTETISITQHLIPPKINSDSAGLMWYYYVTPTVERERWAMQDYDGDLIQPERNLFFFKLNSPQMYDTALSFVNYGTKSPRAYNLESYTDREVANISGVEEITHKGGVVDYAGSTPEINITFSESHETTHTESFEVSVGIEAEEGIFSSSVTITASMEYELESTTTCEHGFDIYWNLFSAKYPDSDSNIRRFTPTAYIMKTTSDNAYFLDNEYVPEEFKKFRPFFITYDIGEISYGDFLDPPYYIGENPELITKYSFSNYPNPFSYKSVFKYTLSERSNVALSIYNTYGQLVSMPVNETQSTGNHQIDFIPADLPSGIYHYRLLIDEDLIMGKIIKH